MSEVSILTKVIDGNDDVCSCHNYYATKVDADYPAQSYWSNDGESNYMQIKNADYPSDAHQLKGVMTVKRSQISIAADKIIMATLKLWSDEGGKVLVNGKTVNLAKQGYTEIDVSDKFTDSNRDFKLEFLPITTNSITVAVKGENAAQIQLEYYETTTVGSAQLESLKITKIPDKTSYVEGQQFDPMGMVVKAFYNDGTSEIIQNYSVNPSGALNTSNTYVAVSYQGKTVRQFITVAAKLLTSISIIKAPNKTSYVEGQQFDSTGMVVKAFYNDGTSKMITDYSYAPVDDLTSRNQYVTVSYTENGVTKTTTQAITVNGKEVYSDKSKPSAENGENPKVNLGTGRLLYTMSDVSIGANSYAINVSHVYNSAAHELFKEKFPGMGRGWKLNVQQYIEQKPNDKYIYVDANGYIHNFVPFDKARNRYNDEEGQGLVLTVDNTIRILEDEQGNKLEFDAQGRLVASVSCENSAIRKVYQYNALGQLYRIYDDRNKPLGTNQPNEYIELTYAENGMLNSIQAIAGTVKQTKYFWYETELLIGKQIVEQDGPKSEVLFLYNADGEMQTLIELSPRVEMKIDYDGQKRVKKLARGISKRDGEFCEKSYVTYTYTTGSYKGQSYIRETDITNKKGVKLVAYLNVKGDLSSMFEQSDGALKTLDRESSKTIAFIGNMSTYINDYSCRQIFDGSLSVDVPSNFKLARNIAEKKNKYFNCSFWLMHNAIIDRLKVVITYSFNLNKTNQGSKTSEVFIDGYAYNVWQKVSIPLIAPEISKDKDINTLSSLSITVRGVDGTVVKEFCLSKLSFSPAPYTEFMLKNNGNIKFKECDKVQLAGFEQSFEFNNTTSTDIYFTEQDLIRTMTNKFAHPYTIGSKTYFDVICNNGTKRISDIWSLYFYAGTRFWRTYESYTPFSSYMIASDNKSTTEQFYKFDDNTFALNTDVKTYPDGVGSSYDSSSKNSIVYDYKGKKLSETDEYQVKTEYIYDEYGNLLRKTIIGSDGKKMQIDNVYDTNGEYLQNSNDGVTTTAYDFVKPLNLPKSESSNGLKSQTVYDGCYNRITSIALFEKTNESNKFKNEITYDNGVIRTVSDGNTKYGIKYEPIIDKTTYTQFDSCNSSAENTIQTEQLIRNIDGGETQETVYKRSDSETDIIVSKTDKYGKLNNVCENGLEKVSYIYSNNDGESDGTNFLDTVVDRYEDKQITYSYDSDGNLIQWEKNTLNGDNELTVQQIFAGDTKYTIGENEKYFTHIVYDSEKNISPRINSTGVSYDSNGDTDDDQKEIKNYRRNYAYDSLGRLITKSTKEDREQSHGISYVVINGNETNIPKGIKYFMHKEKTIFYVVGYKKINYYGNCNDVFEYDSKGNVTKITENGNSYYVDTDYATYGGMTTMTVPIISFNSVRNYTYDSFNRVKTETHSTMEIDRSYEYYPNGKLKAISGTTNKSYIYDERGRLINCGSVIYSYDNYGNRVSKHENGTTVNYKYARGNLLVGIDDNISYSYNAEGVRTCKKFKVKLLGNEVQLEIKYYLDGGKIIGEDRGDEKIRYFYDIDGLCGIRYKNVNYDVVRNSFGDVVMIVKDTNIVARYEYDMWGNCKVYTYKDDDIGNINPFRWKSHYYDADTGYYYANGRYYDPEAGIYLDALEASSVVENAFTPLGLDRNGILCNNIHEFVRNLYAIFTVLEMCPDPNYDPDKNKPWWEIAWNAVTNWFIKAINSIVEWYNNISWVSKVIVGTILFIAAVALTIITHGAIIPLFVGMALSAGIGALQGGANSVENGGSYEEGLLRGLADGVLLGGVFAFVSAGIRAGKFIAKQITQRLIINSYRVFWSGGRDAQIAAETFAKTTGRITLEMSELGIQAAKASEGLLWHEGGEAIWSAASRNYAKAAVASGQKIAHVFLHEPLRNTALWLTTESKILNCAGIKIITHLV